MTWNNRRNGRHHIEERLDRCLVIASWLSLFQNVIEFRLDDLGSNHRLILLNLEPSVHRLRSRFIFYGRWKNDQHVQEIISNSWKNEVLGFKIFSVFTKLKNCRHTIVKVEQPEPPK